MPAFIINLTLTFLVFFSLNVFASVTLDDEISVRESPQQLYNTIKKQLDVDSRPLSQTRLSHDSWGLNQATLFRQYYLLIRLSMESGVTVSPDHPDNQMLITLLEQFAKSPSQRATILMLKGRHIGKNKQDYDQVIDYYQQALALIKEQPAIEAQLLALTIDDHLGSLYLLTRQKETALAHLNALRERAIRLSSSYLLAYANSRLGKFHTTFNQYPQALQYFSQAHQLASEEQQPRLLAMVNFQLSKVYRSLDQLDDALAHAQLAADSFQALESNAYLSQSMTAIALIYAEQEKWQQAIDYYLNAQAIDRRRGNEIFIALNYHNLGEAYSKLGNFTVALSNLHQANQIFQQKNVEHYLIYNEVLIAEVNNLAHHWPAATTHANNALALAEKRQNLEVKIDAKQQLMIALEQLGDTEQALAISKELLQLRQQKSSSQPPKEDVGAALQLQKLQLSLDTVNSRLHNQADSLSISKILLSLCFIGLVITLISVIALALKYTRSKRLINILKQQALQEPITQYPGLNSFVNLLAHNNATRQGTLAIVAIEADVNDDLLLGQSEFRLFFRQQLNELTTISSLTVHALRPGLIGLYSQEQLSGAELVKLITQVWTSTNTWSLGHINLPLMANSDIRIDAQSILQSLQFACAGALSLGQPASYVSLSSLDFTPPTIFTSPIYFRLEQAICRGLIKVECSGDKQQIKWPSAKSECSREDY
ncbi:lipopolysaccharide assembly protein LapB [Shewanella sp. NIFS-20-20]|uniref:tetratricopeptide repeat protein n=1 Tax=Shewanella sp. NIFS-20-20 TaxID=2853806 RepID=UPI001C4511AA|nr:tetratricopeptide repeat protein [Shewanella sp. NIFS-20-20]MBV7315358.1 hypothetical protein [Shewanella sp. NIFS-20-20]